MASFGDFTVARLGMMASQTALNVTGQNIANINTQGYTRQRLDQYSFITNGSGLYRSGSAFTVGSGVMMSGVSQLRDPYLDIRYRQEMSSVGWAGGLLDGYDNIEAILNDVNLDTGLKTALQALEDSFKTLNAEKIGEQEFDTLVRAAADQLCTLLNRSASQLAEELKSNIDDYKQNVEDVNTILKSIQTLSNQIYRAELNGDSVLELRDQRNLEIDKLSEYMKIDVTYSKEDIGAGFTVEKMTIKMVNEKTGKPGKTLIDGSSRTEIGINEDDNFKLTLTELIDMNGKEVSNTKFQLLLSGLRTDGSGGKRNVTCTVGEQQLNILFAAESYGANATAEQIAQANSTTRDNMVQALNNALQGRGLQAAAQGETGISIISTETGADAKTLKFDNLDDIRFAGQNRTEPVPSNIATIEDGMGYGYLESQRQIITGEGEFAMGDEVGVRGIPYYQKSLDAIANKIATEMNRINTTKADGTQFSTQTTKTGDLFIARGDSEDNPQTTITAANISLTKEWQNGSVQIVASDDMSTTKNDNINRFENLFQQTFDYSPIAVARPEDTEYHATFSGGSGATGEVTAKITYLDTLNRPKTVEVKFTPGADPAKNLRTALNNNDPALKDFTDKFDVSVASDELVIKDKVSANDGNSNDQCNVVTGITITGDESLTVKNDFYAGGNKLEGSSYYSGALESYHTNMLGTLGTDKSMISKIYDSYAISADTLNTSRDSVSSVDLNEESINLLQYQKSFAAACRMMTALDELMDRVINGMGVVGR